MEEKEQIKEMNDHQLMVLMAEKAVRNEKLKLIAVIAVAAIAAGIIISLIVVVPQIHGVTLIFGITAMIHPAAMANFLIVFYRNHFSCQWH